MNVIEVNIPLEADRFWNALKIYYQHPNSINKQVLFSEHFFVSEFQTCLTLVKCQELFNNICTILSKKYITKISTEFSQFNIIQLDDVEETFFLPNRMYLLIRKLIPKLNVSDNFEFFEFIFFDKISTNIYIFTKSFPQTSTMSDNIKLQDPLAILKFKFLMLKYDNNGFQISYNSDMGEKGITWLQATFVPKFKKLILNADLCKAKKNFSNLEFDSKVDVVQYYKLYERMKTKYAKYFVENWTENTDPKKFVYEDIGIATYLLMLWNGGNIPEEESKKQRFIDLGCGNGLLVHILNSEGHLGVGLDLRKRKIWDIFPPTTVLKEEVIIPTKQTIFPEADWLIGNHSDELTPWIPIMARLSNNHCQYFVLPCCPYQLNGMKFQRKNSNFSSYQDFINYVKQKSDLCKFETYIDKLRIPSTKRICVVGFSKPEISVENYKLIKDDIIKFIDHECQSFDSEKDNNKQSGKKATVNFKIRNLVEPVRNCTKLPTEFMDNVLKSIMNELLKGQNICTVIKGGKIFSWNRGKKCSIGELASSLNKKTLQQLKNECKGLQTLLKNHHFLFEVAQGFVQFRSPESMLQLINKFLDTHSEEKWKLRKCWLFYNHPDKCPLDDDVCSYSHNKINTPL